MNTNEFSIKDPIFWMYLRNIMLQFIPNFAWWNITVQSKSRTVLNNDQITHIIKTIPFPILLDKEELEKFIEQNKKLVIEGDLNVDIDNTEFATYTMKLKIENNDNQILKNITTDDFTYYKNNKKIDNIYSSVFPILSLKPNQDIEINATTTINIPKYNCIFDTITTPYGIPRSPSMYIELRYHDKKMKRNENDAIEDIIFMAKEIIKKKMEYYLIKSDYEDNKMIYFNDDYHTCVFLCEYINTYFQNEINFIKIHRHHICVKESQLEVSFKKISFKNVLDKLLEENFLDA